MSKSKHRIYKRSCLNHNVNSQGCSERVGERLGDRGGGFDTPNFYENGRQIHIKLITNFNSIITD